MNKLLITLGVIAAIFASSQASAAIATINFSAADIAALAPTTTNSTTTPVVGDGRVDFTASGQTYRTYGTTPATGDFNNWIASLSTSGNGISYFNLWLFDGASNQAALWGETLGLTDPYSADIHPFASAGWNAEVYTIGAEWGAAWTGKKLISYWSADPIAYLSVGTTATFGFTADVRGNNGATGPNYQIWVGGGNDAQWNGETTNPASYGFQRAINAEVPEPATLALFGLALAGLAATRRRKV